MHCFRIESFEEGSGSSCLRQEEDPKKQLGWIKLLNVCLSLETLSESKIPPFYIVLAVIKGVGVAQESIILHHAIGTQLKSTGRGRNKLPFLTFGENSEQVLNKAIIEKYRTSLSPG